MSEHHWCHGPSCHTYSTQDRVRGSKGSKVLRTRKVKQNTEVGMTQTTSIIISVVIIVTMTLQIKMLNVSLHLTQGPSRSKHRSRTQRKQNTRAIMFITDGTRHTWTTTEIKKIDTVTM
jgi:hypothetical protein